MQRERYRWSLFKSQPSVCGVFHLSSCFFVLFCAVIDMIEGYSVHLMLCFLCCVLMLRRFAQKTSANRLKGKLKY